jgi:hypothetical protein
VKIPKANGGCNGSHWFPPMVSAYFAPWFLGFLSA